MNDDELATVREALADVYRPEGIEIWLHAPNRGLDGLAPIDCPADEVMLAIERLASGAMG